MDNGKALGGKDAPVVLIGREAGSGTRDGFEEVTRTQGVDTTFTVRLPRERLLRQIP